MKPVKKQRRLMIAITATNSTGAAVGTGNVLTTADDALGITVQLQQTLVDVQEQDQNGAALAESEMQQAADIEVEEMASQLPQLEAPSGAAVPTAAEPYYRLWLDGMSEDLVVQRWGPDVMAQFKARSRPAAAAAADDGESQTSTELEWAAPGEALFLMPIAPFEASELDVNLARWEAWTQGRLQNEKVLHEGGEALLRWLCLVSQHRGVWGVREQECRRVLGLETRGAALATFSQAEAVMLTENGLRDRPPASEASGGDGVLDVADGSLKAHPGHAAAGCNLEVPQGRETAASDLEAPQGHVAEGLDCGRDSVQATALETEENQGDFVGAMGQARVVEVPRAEVSSCAHEVDS